MHTKQQIDVIVRKIFANVLGYSYIHDDDTQKSLGGDVGDAAEIVNRLEEDLDIEITIADEEKYYTCTVKEIIDDIVAHQ